MIRDLEVSRQMADIQDRFHRVAQGARANGLNELADAIVENANIATSDIEQRWLNSPAAREYIAPDAPESVSRAEVIDSLRPDQSPLYLSREQFSESAERLGHTAAMASRLWNSLLFNVYATSDATWRPRNINGNSTTQRVHQWGEIPSSYPVKIVRVPVPNYSQKKDGYGLKPDQTLVVDVQSIHTAIAREAEDVKHPALSLKYRLGAKSVELLNEISYLYHQPSVKFEERIVEI